MTNYTMPVLSEHEKQRLINFCKADLSNWSPDGDYYPLLRIALAALTAKPVDPADCFCELYPAPPVPVKQEGEQG